MKEKLMNILAEICPEVDFDTETALIDDGLLESLDIVMIVTEVMQEFGVELTVDDLLPENFNSADALLSLIESRI